MSILILYSQFYFQDENGNYVYNYLFVKTDDYGRAPIVLEDNRLGNINQPKGKHSDEGTRFLKEIDLENVDYNYKVQ